MSSSSSEPSRAGDRIVEAARRLLAEEGPSAVTVTRVATALQQKMCDTRADILREFGDVSGVLRIVIASLTREAMAAAQRRADAACDAEDPVAELVTAHRRMGRDYADYRMFYRLLPEALGDTVLTEQFRSLYDWYRQQDGRTLARASGLSGDEVRAVGAVATAVLDGLALQRQIDPDGFDLDAAFDTWDAILRLWASERGARHDRREA